ncbi:MAG: trehalose-phosphatase [PVC group bacterium]
MRSLLRNWGAVSDRISRGRVVLLCFDYDGTLTPIVESPEAALLPDETRDLLRSLSRHPRYRPAVVSGRSLREVRSLVGLDKLIYAGNHGLELEGDSLQFVHPGARAARPVIGKAAECLRRELAEIAGARVEDKGLSLSVHFRRVARGELDRTVRIIMDITRGPVSRGEVKVSCGKKVIEIRPPVDWDKGGIVNWLAREIVRGQVKDAVLTVYTGDDRTDEDAFRAIGDAGITIRVGGADGHSAARYYLEDVSRVRIFMSRLLELS